MTRLRHFFDLKRHNNVFNPELRQRVALWSRQDLRYPVTNMGSLVRKHDWLVRREMQRPH